MKKLEKPRITLVSAEVAAGGEPAEADAAPSSLAPDMEPEGVLLCEGACNESPESCFDMMPPLGALTHTTVVSCSISFIVIFLVLEKFSSTLHCTAHLVLRVGVS